LRRTVAPTRLNYQCQHERNGANGSGETASGGTIMEAGPLVPGAQPPATRWRDPAPAAVSWPLPRYVADKAHHMPQKLAARPNSR
jgi:hypothetical protein